MTYQSHPTLLVGLLLGLGLASPAAAQETPPVTSRVELTLVQQDGRTQAFSLSMGQGTYVETQSFASADVIATGVIASDAPVGSSSTENGFELYTSDVGTTLQP